MQCQFTPTQCSLFDIEGPLLNSEVLQETVSEVACQDAHQWFVCSVASFEEDPWCDIAALDVIWSFQEVLPFLSLRGDLVLFGEADLRSELLASQCETCLVTEAEILEDRGDNF